MAWHAYLWAAIIRKRTVFGATWRRPCMRGVACFHFSLKNYCYFSSLHCSHGLSLYFANSSHSFWELIGPNCTKSDLEKAYRNHRRVTSFFYRFSTDCCNLKRNDAIQKRCCRKSRQNTELFELTPHNLWQGWVKWPGEFLKFSLEA